MRRSALRRFENPRYGRHALNVTAIVQAGRLHLKIRITPTGAGEIRAHVTLSGSHDFKSRLQPDSATPTSCSATPLRAKQQLQKSVRQEVLKSMKSDNHSSHLQPIYDLMIEPER